MGDDKIYVCVFCEKRIWKDTDGWRHESSGSMPICNSKPEPKTTITCPQCEGAPDLCNGYCEGTGTVTTNHAEEWHRQNDDPTLSWENDVPIYTPKAGKTLVDFAKTRTPLFKRPMHRNPYGFTAGGDHLREIRGLGTKDTFVDFARLTAEDLTANDWEEVTEEVSN
jgi:DNA-directed RNA polymerase subunit RPC12/RpoP